MTRSLIPLPPVSAEPPNPPESRARPATRTVPTSALCRVAAERCRLDCLSLCHLCACDASSDEAELEMQVLAAVDSVADLLRNTREVARNAYVHPVLLELHREGKLRSRWPDKAAAGGRGKGRRKGRGRGEASDDLGPAEAALLALLDDVDER